MNTEHENVPPASNTSEKSPFHLSDLHLPVLNEDLTQDLTEETVLFFSLIKWLVLAIVTGGLVGLFTGGFLLTFQWSVAHLTDNILGRSWNFLKTFHWKLPSASLLLHSYFFLHPWLFLPLVFALAFVLKKHVFSNHKELTTDSIIDSINKRQWPSFISSFKTACLSLFTISFGAALGREAPCADMGGYLGSVVGRFLKLRKEDIRILMVCGVSAGFAAALGVPIAGSIFGLEVLCIGEIFYEALFPAFVSGILAYNISSAMGADYFYHPKILVPVFSETYLVKVFLGGIFLGLCAFVFIEILHATYKMSQHLKLSTPVKGILGGGILVLLTLWLGPLYLGMGQQGLQTAVGGGKIAWYAFLVKAIFVSISASFGGVGGLVVPLFFIGAAAGNLFAFLSGLNPSNWAAFGAVSLLAGGANTPIAASIMFIELFGPRLASYAAIVCMITFMMTGHRSAFPSQILSIKKSSSLQIELGGKMEGLHPDFRPRRHRIIRRMFTLLRLLRQALHFSKK